MLRRLPGLARRGQLIVLGVVVDAVSRRHRGACLLILARTIVLRDNEVLRRHSHSGYGLLEFRDPRVVCQLRRFHTIFPVFHFGSIVPLLCERYIKLLFQRFGFFLQRDRIVAKTGVGVGAWRRRCRRHLAHGDLRLLGLVFPERHLSL